MPSQVRLALIPPSHRRLTPLLSVDKPSDPLSDLAMLAGAVSKSGLRGTIVFKIHRPNAEAAYILELETRRAVIGEHEKPDIRISVTETAWRQILSGRLSPWKALATRRLLVNGDLSLAQKVVEALARK